jgi:folate-dependent tRNA-U54 methylase TrmFO/GidA
VCALVITLSLWGTAQQLAKTYPIDMWEAGLLAESFRFANALPVYEDARSGHATNMYGPLAPTGLPRGSSTTPRNDWPLLTSDTSGNRIVGGAPAGMDWT